MNQFKKEKVLLWTGISVAALSALTDIRAGMLKEQLNESGAHMLPQEAYDLNNWAESYRDISLASLVFSGTLLIVYFWNYKKS